MRRYEIRNGDDPEATLIGIVHATSKPEAISTLNASGTDLG